MGRAGRPNNQHPALRELEEEGLPPGWKEYWQGGKGVIIEAVDPRDLTDQELLEQIASSAQSYERYNAGAAQGVLQRGGILTNKEKNDREYRGGVRITVSRDGEAAYQGFTEWGRARSLAGGGGRRTMVYEGQDLHAAVRAVNATLDKKVKSGYESSITEDVCMLSHYEARKRAEEIFTEDQQEDASLNKKEEV